MKANKTNVKKVLVVGGAGYIGGSVTDLLIKNKIPFTVFDNLLYENHYLKPVDFIYGDIRDYKTLSQVLKKYSHVIWLAAIVGDGACAIKPNITRQINQDAVKYLSKEFKGRILFTSTCSVYGRNDSPVHELSPTNPLSVYAETKLQAENYLKDTNSLIFRLGTAFGLSDTYSRIRMDLAVNYMTMTAIRNKKLTVFGGNQWRPFIHVKDIGNAIVGNLTSDHKGIYNLTTENTSITNVAKLIQLATNCKIVKTKQKFEDDRSYRAITTKAIKDNIFSNNTKQTIAFGVNEVANLVKSNRIKNLDKEIYSNVKHLLNAIQNEGTYL